MNAAGHLNLGACALGRAIDARGHPLDAGPMLRGRRVCLEVQAPRPDERVPIATPLWTGVRVIDGLLTLGRGARIGIFGAPGSGKSVLVEAMVTGCVADAIVVALVGERGREAQRWIALRNDRTTVVCATSDRPASERIAAARIALAHAVALRNRGLGVLLIVDSLARVAAALRETAVANGEIVGRAGYPPSVFANLARMVETAGAAGTGSITMIATVLHDGDERDPVSEAARACLDGHIALSNRLAESGRFPAVNVLGSASRTMEAVTQAEHRHAALRVRAAIALLDRIEDARALGIVAAERSARSAIDAEASLEAFLRQDRRPCEPGETLAQLIAIADRLERNDTDR
jgi:ATP synthase in type III secretion protein N